MDDVTDDPEDGTAPTSSYAADQNDPLEGSSSRVFGSLIDERPTDSATSSGRLSDPTESAECEKCSKTAALSLYKSREPMNGGRTEDIYKNYCEHCKAYFGMCSKKVRGVFSYVTEDGRILTNAEKLEFFRGEKRKRSSSRLISGSPKSSNEPGTGESAMLTNGNRDEEDDEGIDEKIEEDEDDDNGGQKVDEEVEVDREAQKKNTLSRKKAKRHAFGGKSKKTNWTTSRKKPQSKAPQGLSISEPARTVKKPVKIVPINKPSKAILNSTKKTTPVNERTERGRPMKTSAKVNKVDNTSSTFSRNSPSASTKPLFFAETSESSCQTDINMLLKSTYLEDAFNQTVQDGLGEHIAVRLKGQPMMLRKQFMIMLKTIQSQEQTIIRYRDVEENYKMAVKNLTEFGRTTRLAFYDEFRNIRGEILERKEEFKAHETEMISMFIKEKSKYESHKAEMIQSVEDHKLENSALEAKVKFLEQENIYEKERAEYFLRTMDVSKKEAHLARESADTANKNLADKLYLRDHQKCEHCQAADRKYQKMASDVAEMEKKTEKADADKKYAVEKAEMFESAASKLGKDCDTLKYERDSWKTYANKYKKDIQNLTQSLKEKEKELSDKVAELAETPRSITTPKSVACTPVYTERITPPEDCERTSTPPQGSPHMNTAASKSEKPLIQKIVEKNAPPSIASGFESWIPQEKRNAPLPVVPKAVSAFGVPMKTPQQRETETPRFAPSSQPNPWEKLAKTTSSITSDSLSQALAEVRGESFSGVVTSLQKSKAFTEEMSRIANARKRVVEESKKPNSSDPTAPLVKKNKPDDTVLISSNSPTTTVPPKIVSSETQKPLPSKIQGPVSNIGSLSNLRKIPKLSEKPPQAEFAPALGLVERNNADSSIPGLGINKLDENTKEKEKEDLMKIKPAVVKTATPTHQPNSTNYPPSTQNQHTNAHNSTPQTPSIKKTNSPMKKKKNKHSNYLEPPNSQASSWQRNQDSSPPINPWRQEPVQLQYGIQTNQQRNYPIDLGLDRPWSDSSGSSRNGGRQSESFSSLPWHRDNFQPTPVQETPFGKVPIRDNFAMNGPRPMLHRPTHPPSQSSSFYNNSRDNNFYSPPSRGYPPAQPPPQSRMFLPPQFGYSGPPNASRGNQRSFYS